MSTKTIYIQPETDAALSKLGGANRAENLRRAVALAEVAGELAEVLQSFERAQELWLPVEVEPGPAGEARALYGLKGNIEVALTHYRRDKNVN